MDLRGYDTMNPVSGFIQGYTAASALGRKDREEARADEKWALEKQALNLQLQNAQDQQSLRRWQGLKAKMISMPDTWFEALTPDEEQLLKTQIATIPQYSWLGDPQQREAKKAAIMQLYQSLPNAQRQNFDGKLLLPALNTLYADQLKGGTDDTGQPALRKEITGFHPTPTSQKDGSFFAELTVTRQDGSQYKAPLTVARSANPQDQVRPITIQQVADNVRGIQGLINFADSKMISLGDQSAMKSMEARARGQQLMQSAGAIDTSQPVAQQRLQLMGSAVGAGYPLNEATGFANSAVTDQKYAERTVPISGDRMAVKQSSTDGGRTWQTIGQPFPMDSAQARGEFRTDDDLKYQRQLVQKEIDAQEKRVAAIESTIHKYQANKGQEISETNDILGTTTRKKITDADIDGLRQELSSAQTKLQDLRDKAASPEYLRKRAGISSNTNAAGGGQGVQSSYTPQHPDTQFVLEGIAGTETPGEADPYSAPNRQGSGAHGKYQFMPGTWERVSKEFTQQQFGVPFVLPMNSKNQETLATWDVDQHLMAGNTPDQVYNYWYTGDENTKLTKGPGANGIAYDVEDYRRKANAAYSRAKAGKKGVVSDKKNVETTALGNTKPAAVDVKTTPANLPGKNLAPPTGQQGGMPPDAQRVGYQKGGPHNGWEIWRSPSMPGKSFLQPPGLSRQAMTAPIFDVPGYQTAISNLLGTEPE